MLNRRFFEGKQNHTIYALNVNRVIAHETTVGPQTEKQASLNKSVAVWLHLYPAKLTKGGLGEIL